MKGSREPSHSPPQPPRHPTARPTPHATPHDANFPEGTPRSRQQGTSVSSTGPRAGAPVSHPDAHCATTLAGLRRPPGLLIAMSLEHVHYPRAACSCTQRARDKSACSRGGTRRGGAFVGHCPGTRRHHTRERLGGKRSLPSILTSRNSSPRFLSLGPILSSQSYLSAPTSRCQ